MPTNNHCLVFTFNFAFKKLANKHDAMNIRLRLFRKSVIQDFFYKTKWDYENKVSIAESKKCTQKVREIYAALQGVLIRNI